ncbi:hypothetical protein L1049_026689 [Liquidambar formosana]|uniref:CTLH domain-containing protein n=1 Tax=Liquidambar formosana TaxID=63359 RepID=A0AAP0NG03_LIQFO
MMELLIIFSLHVGIQLDTGLLFTFIFLYRLKILDLFAILIDDVANCIFLCPGIFHFALEGNALKAIELTEQLARDLLENNKDLHFDLLSLHFVELVCSRKCTEALEFAQTNLTPFGKVQEYVEKLEDFMALLAYEEPEKSPMFYLLSLEYRQEVADSLNRAILAHANKPSYSAMERLIQQTTAVRQCLNQELGKDGLQPFSLTDFLKS